MEKAAGRSCTYVASRIARLGYRLPHKPIQSLSQELKTSLATLDGELIQSWSASWPKPELPLNKLRIFYLTLHI